MKKILLFFSVVACFWMVSMPPQTADAYWRYRRFRPSYQGPKFQRQVFQPVFSMTVAGGLHFVDIYDDNPKFYQSSYGFTYGLVEIGFHYWIHPRISVDLDVGGHFATPMGYDQQTWGYVSVKPGLRWRLGRILYVRTALDVAFGEEDQRRSAFLIGGLVGLGLRVPVSYRARFLAELNYQFLVSKRYYMPFYGKIGMEFMF